MISLYSILTNLTQQLKIVIYGFVCVPEGIYIRQHGAGNVWLNANRNTFFKICFFHSKTLFGDSDLHFYLQGKLRICTPLC